MPLIESWSRRAISENIRSMMREGKPQRQAVAIALGTARRARANAARKAARTRKRKTRKSRKRARR